AVRSVASRAGRTVETDDGRAERVGEMQRTGVGADDELRGAEELGELAQIRLWRERCSDRFGELPFAGTPRDHDVIAELSRELAKALDRPEFLGAAGARENDDASRECAE